MSTSTLTPAQKALVKAQNLQAELECDDLQKVLTSKALSDAKRRMAVSHMTRDVRIQARIDDRLAQARAISHLSESDRQLLTGKSPTDKGTKKSTKTDNGTKKRTSTDASVQ